LTVTPTACIPSSRSALASQTDHARMKRWQRSIASAPLATERCARLSSRHRPAIVRSRTAHPSLPHWPRPCRAFIARTSSSSACNCCRLIARSRQRPAAAGRSQKRLHDQHVQHAAAARSTPAGDHHALARFAFGPELAQWFGRSSGSGESESGRGAGSWGERHDARRAVGVKRRSSPCCTACARSAFCNPAGLAVPGLNFSVIAASRYSTRRPDNCLPVRRSARWAGIEYRDAARTLKIQARHRQPGRIAERAASAGGTAGAGSSLQRRLLGAHRAARPMSLRRGTFRLPSP